MKASLSMGTLHFPENRSLCLKYQKSPIFMGSGARAARELLVVLVGEWLVLTELFFHPP